MGKPTATSSSSSSSSSPSVVDKFSLVKCASCSKMVHFQKMSRRQKLCPDCKSTLPFSMCRFCMLEYQDKQKGDACSGCKSRYDKYGEPTKCKYCKTPSAFGPGDVCSPCQASINKYGKPKECRICKRVAAFDKGKDKVTAGLCVYCTVEESKRLKREQKSGSAKKRLANGSVIGDDNKRRKLRTNGSTGGTPGTDSNAGTPRAISARPPPIDCGTDVCCAQRARLNTRCSELKREWDQMKSTTSKQMTQISNLEAGEAYLKGKHKAEISQLTLKFKSEILMLQDQVRELQRQLKSVGGEKKKMKPAAARFS